MFVRFCTSEMQQNLTKKQNFKIKLLEVKEKWDGPCWFLGAQMYMYIILGFKADPVRYCNLNMMPFQSFFPVIWIYVPGDSFVLTLQNITVVLKMI